MIYKLIIIGSGPAGYTAGIYAGRAELEPLLFTGEKSGGQLMNTTLVENWPGVKDGIMGPELMTAMREQAKKFGTEIIDRKVSRVDLRNKIKKVWVGDQEYKARAVIAATGAEPVMLKVPGEQELMGRGVSVCAVCDAPFFKDKTTLVIGGGDAAVEDALALTKFAKKVYLVHRRDELRASKIMIKRVMSNPKIEILWNTELKEVRGKGRVEEVVLEIESSELARGVRNLKTMEADGVFLAIGHKPATKIFKGQLMLDKKGYIKVNMEYPILTKTNLKGVFAAGDVVDYRYQQAVTAAGMGCQAAIDAEKYLENK